MIVRKEVMPYDTRRSNQIFRCKKCSARNGRPAAGLHLQIRLHEGWNTGLCVAVDLMWAPFGLHRMCLWIIPGGRSFGGGIATMAFNFIIGGVIGGFVLVWRLLVAAWNGLFIIFRIILSCNI